MRGHLVMSAKERKRKVEFEGVQEGRMTIKEAAAKLRKLGTEPNLSP